MFCVRFKGAPCSVGYLRPWNSVRDGETYSLTYLPTSVIDGISHELGCAGKILRHKLRFNGMTDEMFRSEEVKGKKLYKKKKRIKTFTKRKQTISTIHQICDPEIILGFECKEDAVNASKNSIYVGQTQYIIYPASFDDLINEVVDCDDNIIVELTDDEFSAIRGTETFPTEKNDENGIYCGNNRFRDNERMYIRIVRTK